MISSARKTQRRLKRRRMHRLTVSVKVDQVWPNNVFMVLWSNDFFLPSFPNLLLPLSIINFTLALSVDTGYAGFPGTFSDVGGKRKGEQQVVRYRPSRCQAGRSSWWMYGDICSRRGCARGPFGGDSMTGLGSLGMGRADMAFADLSKGCPVLAQYSSSK